MIDIIFPIGKGSIWQDNELRYSLRSIDKHLNNFRNIYLIGELPSFIQNVIHISYQDVELSKETNIYKKILRACQEKQLSDDFLFFNDDHFLLNDFDACTFPFFCKGDLVTTVQKLPHYSKYGESVLATARVLHELGLPTLNFDTHTPIIYNKNRFLQIMPQYDWTFRYGYTVKSLYANSLRIQGIREPDCKINFQGSKEQIYNCISDRKVWSIGNKAFNEPLCQVLQELYPNPSRWEKI